MNIKFLSILIFIIELSVSSLFATDYKLPGQLPSHPRIYLTDSRVEEIKDIMKTDPFLERQVKELQSKAARLLAETRKEGQSHPGQPTVNRYGLIRYEFPDGMRLLGASWMCIARVTTFAFVYRMTGQQEYADAAIEEMLNVCRFKDWHPRHFLDTGEMAAAVALGYDWLYNVIPVDKRDEIRKALIRHGLKAGNDYYENKRHWAVSASNWNEVCNNGMMLAVLAIADEEHEAAEKTFKYAMESIPYGLSTYAPEGTYPEGGNYWNYGTLASCMTIAAMQDVLGSDFGLLNTPGFKTTGDFFMGIVRPDFWYFNYSDCPDEALPNPAMFYLSRVFNRPDYAAWLRNFVETRDYWQIWSENSREGDEAFRDYDRYAVLRAVWYNPTAVGADFTATPLAKHFEGKQDLAVMRTRWKDRNAAFAALKAGSNRSGHCHLDIGTFVYDNHGYRWAVDLGRDMASYRVPGNPWRLFRLTNRGHNTLLIADSLQNLKASCQITKFETNKKGIIGRAVADITDAYSNQVKSAIRTLTLKKDGTLIVEDEIEGAVDKVRWAMITPAAIDIRGKKALLTQGDKKVTVTLQSGEAVKFEQLPVKPKFDYENPNQGYAMLAAFATPKNGKINIKVILRP
ncbi:MAG: heparinase II/III family protein [Proteiniphilum sp.]